MGDASYKNIDFERMLSDLGQALERNKARAEPGTMPAQVAAPSPTAPAVPTARFADVPAQTITGTGKTTPLSPQDQQTSSQLDQVQTAAPNGVPFGSSPSRMSPADLQTLAELNAIRTTGPGGVPFGSSPGIVPHPAHAPPPAIAAQLAGIAQQPTAASAPPTVYPNLNPQDPNAGLAAYAMQNR